MVPPASAPLGAADEPEAEYREPLTAEYLANPVALYRLELERSKHRREAARKVEMAKVEKAWKAAQKREEELRKGGRPKGSKTGAFPIAIGKPGKPQLQVQREQIPDLAACLNPFYGS